MSEFYIYKSVKLQPSLWKGHLYLGTAIFPLLTSTKIAGFCAHLNFISFSVFMCDLETMKYEFLIKRLTLVLGVCVIVVL